MTDNSRSAVDYAQGEQSKQDRYTREDAIEEWIEKCSRALARSQGRHFRYAAEHLRDDLLPLLRQHTGAQLIEYADVIADHEQGDWAALSKFSRDPDQYVAAFENDVGGVRDRRTVEQALRSAMAIAESEDIVLDGYTARADAVGFSTKLGEHLQDGRMNIGDPVELVTDEQVDAVKWLVCGGTGMGKSTGTEQFVNDYYQANFQEGRNYKVIDLLGFRQGENWVPDVPQQQDDLRRIREEHGLPPSFDESDDLGDPEIEILHPMTRGFASKELPFDTDAEEFTVTPFTIPASEFRKPVMVSLLMSRLSESEEATIREVYDAVDEDQHDWSLADLADAIRARQELSDKHKSKAIGVLRSLQNEGFIRTHDDEHTLTWTDLFRDTDTYTVFSQALCERDLTKLMTFAYLADSAYRQREKMPFSDECVLVMREFWEVVPHKRRRSFDAREAGVQEAIGHILQKLFRQNRHSGIHVICDTQQPSDLLKSVREMFNQYVVYSANRDTIDDLFEWTQNNKRNSFWSTMTAKAGQAGVIGQPKPAIENRDIEFLSPVEITPPPHHHFDVKTDGTGWHARAKYLDHEELRRPAETAGIEWDDDVPEELTIQSFAESVEEESRPDPETFPLKAFAYECLVRQSGTNTAKQEVYDAFNEYAKAHGHDRWDFNDQGVKTKFGQKLTKLIEGGVETTQLGSGTDRVTAYRDVALTNKGTEYLDEATIEATTTAAPMRTDGGEH